MFLNNISCCFNIKYLQVYLRSYLYIYLQVYLRSYLYIYLQVYLRSYLYIYLQVYLRSYLYIYLQVYFCVNTKINPINKSNSLLIGFS